MEINWFTFVAQIVNFLVLVAILQRFLYRPVIRAMDHREQMIEDRLAAAEQKQQSAQQLMADCQHQRQVLIEQREMLQQQIRVEVEQQRQALLQTARQEVEAVQQRWRMALQRQRTDFLQELRHRILKQIQITLRMIFQDMADVDLERQIIKRFLKDLEALSVVELQTFRQAIATNASPEPLVIYTTFEIPEAEREQIIRVIQLQQLGSGRPAFARADHLICGVELRTSGCKLAWSIENYLDNLDEALTQVFDEEAEIAL